MERPAQLEAQRPARHRRARRRGRPQGLPAHRLHLQGLRRLKFVPQTLKKFSAPQQTKFRRKEEEEEEQEEEDYKNDIYT